MKASHILALAILVCLALVRDHVGSIVALVGDGGKIVEENSYDAWGRMRDPDTHEVYLMDKVPGLTLGRGYGSHEYLHRFGLVNMNARLYDPVLGRFASPDPYVQDPTLPQNFNRYSYCLNNPLLYCDQSGEWFGIDDLFIAAAGFVAGYLSNAISTGNWGWSSVKSGLIGAGMCWLGYNTAGLATGAINGATWTHAASIGISSLSSCLIPSITLPILSGWGISISPLIGFGTGGISLGTGVSIYGEDGDWCFGAGVGIGGNINAKSKYVGYNAMIGHGKAKISYGITMYGESTVNGKIYEAQNVGTVTVGWNGGSFSLSNDLFAEKEDRFRTTAAELTIKNFSIGTYVDTNNGKKDNQLQTNRETSTHDNPNPVKSKEWDKGLVYAAPLWFGYKQGNNISRIGFHHELIQRGTQNFIHSLIGSKYYTDYSQMTRGLYSYYGTINPFNLWNY